MDAARRQPVPRRIRLYILAVGTLTAGVTPFAVHFGGAVHGAGSLVLAAALAGMITLAYRHPVQVGDKRRVNVGAAPEVAAVMLLPGPLAVAVLAAACWFGESHGRPPLIQRLFNTQVAMLRAVAGMALGAFAGRAMPWPAGASLASALATAVAMYLVAVVLVLGIAAVQLRDNPVRRMWASQKDAALIEASLLGTGIMAALATAQEAWALPLLAAPAALAYRALRDGVALQAQTRLALEELADIVDLRDRYTFEHSRRVSELARATAKMLGMGAAEVDLVTMAARVHDVGKIGIKSSVLMKPGRLTEGEWDEMRSHPEVGAKLIARFPYFAPGRALVLHHHERFDGKGYPHGLAGDQIPLGARILAVADAWDAMTSNRAYRRGLEAAVARAEIEKGCGTQFDQAVAQAFLRAIDERPDLATPGEHTPQGVDELPAAAEVTSPARVA